MRHVAHCLSVSLIRALGFGLRALGVRVHKWALVRLLGSINGLWLVYGAPHIRMCRVEATLGMGLDLLGFTHRYVLHCCNVGKWALICWATHIGICCIKVALVGNWVIEQFFTIGGRWMNHVSVLGKCWVV